MKVDVLGVKIDDINLNEALARVERWIEDSGKHYIVTPNPEIVVAASKDHRLRSIINDADLSIPDGVGLKFSGNVNNTLAGTDLMEKLAARASEKGFTVGFLGGHDKVADRSAECLKKKYPGLKVVFAEAGPEVQRDGNMSSDYRLPTKADILFVAFGHIKQEKWIAGNLDKIPVKIAMGVGGAFDYLSGHIPRAPKWVRDLGFEWLFRLFVQPRRIKRQLALLQYLWLLIRQK